MGITQGKGRTAIDYLDLILKAQSNDSSARNQLIDLNYDWITKLANKYVALCNSVVEKRDLHSEAVLAFTHAVNKYDPSRGAQLRTYASTWIRNNITEYLIRNLRSYNIPLDLGKKLNALNKNVDNKELGSTNIQNDAMVLKQADIELDSIDQNSYKCEFFASDNLISLEEKAATLNLIRRTLDVRKADFPREAEAISLYYGLEGTEMNLREIGEVFEVSKARAGAIVKSGIKHLQKSL